MEKIVVIGGGESGVGSAVLAKVKGFDVFLSDGGSLKENYRAELHKFSIPFEENKHTESKILNASLVIKSPGVPDTAEIITAIKKKGIKVISEIEFAGRYSKAKRICITGSNGKTTTTTLTYQLLKNAGFNVGLAGNIGLSYAYDIATSETPKDWYVIELSSFQLDGIFDFRSDIAVLMNITPDHLDRYDYKMINYVNSKFRIIRNQSVDQNFIYCSDDPVITNYLPADLPMSLFPFSVERKESPGSMLVGDTIRITVEGKVFEINRNNLKVKGIHNVYNVMASVTCALLAGVPEASIRKTLETFGGIEHRMEHFYTSPSGVNYINDSKATNVDSVRYALGSMTAPTVWIAGGTDKGNDYKHLHDLASKHVKALICMGLDNVKLVKSFEGKVHKIYDVDTLNEAVDIAVKIAKKGDTVLLSPACASFDLFKNYEDRGQQFKDAVINKNK